jgi:hypothetical protein
MRKLFVVLTLVFAIPQSSPAQTASALRQGAVIEVTPVQGKRQVGILRSVSNDSLLFSPDRHRAQWIWFAPADLRMVRVSEGQSTAGSVLLKGLIGTVIGGAGGALFGAATYDPQRDHDFFTSSKGGKAAAYGILGGLSGLIIGGIYGAARADQHWEVVNLPQK